MDRDDDEASIQRVLTAAAAAQMGAPLTPAQEATYRRLRREVADREAEAAAWTADLAARDQLLVQIERRGVPLPYPIDDAE